MNIFRCLALGFYLFIVGQALQAEPLLWKVEPADRNAPSATVYLFGSIHYGESGFYPLTETIQQAFDQSTVLAVELNALELDPVEAASAIKRHGRYRPSKNLRSELPASDWRKLTLICEKLGVDPNSFSGLKPWLVATQLLGLQIEDEGFSQSLGVDLHILGLADKQRIVELETIEQQLSILGGLGSRAQTLFLRHALQGYEENGELLKTMADSWLKGDEEVLNALIHGSFGEDEDSQRLYREIFVERNLNMAQAAEGFLAGEEPVFMVVGLGHLLGKDGLVAELQRRNYRVTKLSPIGS